MLIFFPLCLRSRDPAEKTMASASARRPTHSSSRTACGVTAANESTLPLDDATSEELLQLTVVQVAPHRMGKGLFAKLNHRAQLRRGKDGQPNHTYSQAIRRSDCCKAWQLASRL